MKSLNNPNQYIFQDMIRKARLDAGLTQAKLAKKLNKPQSYVAKYEIGERRLDVIELLDVIDAIGGNAAIFIAAFNAERNSDNKLKNNEPLNS